MANDLETPHSKWTKKDYLDTVKGVGELTFYLGIIGVGAAIGYAIDCDLGGRNLFTFLGAVTGGTLVSFQELE